MSATAATTTQDIECTAVAFTKKQKKNFPKVTRRGDLGGGLKSSKNYTQFLEQLWNSQKKNDCPLS